MATGKRLLTQVMPYQYRQGFTYPIQGCRYQRKQKIYGGKMLRRWLKENLKNETY